MEKRKGIFKNVKKIVQTIVLIPSFLIKTRFVNSKTKKQQSFAGLAKDIVLEKSFWQEIKYGFCGTG
jgi:hypothetical protein